MGKLANVWAFSGSVEHYAELMSDARLWSEQVHLIVQGNEQANQVKPLGTDEIVVLETTSSLQRVENFTEAITALIQENTGLLLMPATKCIRSLGAWLIIQLNAAMVSDAASVTLNDGSLFVEYRMHDGPAFGRERIKTTQAIITPAPGVLEPVEANASYTCPVASALYIAPRHEIMCQGRRTKSVSSVDLSKARRVVDVGRGPVAQDGLEMVHQSAPILGTEVGCSRPITGDENWMERERYIGVSGVLLGSGPCLTLDISGQIRYTVGGNGARAIVAIDKDKKALTLNYVNYGLADDIYKVVPVLIEHLSRQPHL